MNITAFLLGKLSLMSIVAWCVISPGGGGVVVLVVVAVVSGVRATKVLSRRVELEKLAIYVE